VKRAFRALARRIGGLFKAEQQPADAPLREFVYLDQVSVYSLIASRLGAVAAEVTDTESSTVSEELQSSVGASAGVLRSELGTRSHSSQSAASQVLRKSVIQSTFKDLVEIEQESMALRAPGPNASPPQIDHADGLQELLSSQGPEAWVVDPLQLRRGQLFEVEVTLEADAIFRASTIMSTVLEIVRQNPSLGGFDGPGELERALTADRLLQALLVGLVPLRASAVDYRHVTSAGRELLVHRALLEDLPASADLVVRSLQVVGVAEEGLFWRDIRRVLFSHSHYRVLGRLGRDGVQRSWSPVKLADILKEIVPNMADELGLAGEGFLAAMARAGAGEQDDDAQLAQRMRDALISYAAMLAAEHDKTYTADQLAAHGLPSVEQCSSYTGVEAQRGAFAPITERLQRDLEIPEDTLRSAQLRKRALDDAGISPSGELLGGAQSPAPSAVTEPGSSARYLDAEIVAIYW
jgi:hypothetical protein